MPKLIALDVDGTFLDSLGFFTRVIEDYSRERGFPMPCIPSINRGYHDPVNHDFKWGMSGEDQLTHLKAVWAIADRLGTEGPAPALFCGVKETLAALKNAGYTLAIVTSKPEAPLRRVLEDHEIKDMFSACRSLCDIRKRGEREKPEPDMLQSILRELSFAPDNAVMIGDTTMDIRMGIASSTQTVGVTWGAHPKQNLLDAGAHHIVETHFPDVAATVRRIFA